MSNLNQLGFTGANFNSPFAYDIWQVTKAIPPATTPGALLLGPNAIDQTAAVPTFGYKLTKNAGGAAPADGEYFTLPIKIQLLNGNWETKHLLVVSAAL
jgi:hypothetical protein